MEKISEEHFFSIDTPIDPNLSIGEFHNEFCEMHKGQFEISQEIKDWKTAKGVLVAVMQYNRKVARSNRN